MQKYREINGNDYVKDSRATINETMQSIQSMNSGTAFPTNNLFEGMKCYRTDLKKTYTLTDVENGTWVEDAHATLSDEATHAAAADTATTASNVSEKIYYSADSPSVATNKLFTVKQAHAGEDNVPNNGLVIQSGPTGAKYNGKLYITDNGTDGVWIGGVAAGKEVGWTRLVENRGSWNINSATATKFAAARAINITGNASGSASFDGSGDISISTTVNESKHAVNADVAKTLETTDANGVKSNGQFYWVGKDGQPMWLWGSNTKPSETYVYNPSNFHVAYADNATNAATATEVNAIAPNGGTADLVFGIMANDDSARIRVGGSSNNGWLEIATSDDGDEPIYVRQYSGRFGQNEAKTVTNEAVLLDGNGNTKFPHNVTAANFVGHLAGNADTATNANHASNADSAADVTNATVSPGVSNINGVTVPASGAIDGLNAVTGSNDLTSTSKLRSYIGSVYNGYWYNVISIRHRNGADDGTVYGMLIYSNLTDNWDAIHYKKQGIGWTEERTLLDSENYNAYVPTKTGGGASGTWGINISGNAASATNADKVDGYHASDIINKISAANTGGIVAASLTKNGYVKFANGLILQWGYGNDDADTTFPISFKSFVRVVCTCDNHNWVWTRDITTTGFSLRASGGACWLAVGM